MSLSLNLQSCYSKGKIADQIRDISPKLTEDNISALNEINLTDFRNAKDNKEGSLYYAGLLWFWNNDLDKAEIAWKRSARTGVSPWKKESARLVAYLLTRRHKYNQIAPFVESIMTSEDIMKDPEIFSYYARALWSDKNYESLNKLLALTPQFSPTIRFRVSIEQALIEYNMWKSFILISENTKNAPEILRDFLVNNTYNFNNSEFNIFLNQIPNFNTENLSQDLITMISLRSETLSSQEKFDSISSIIQNAPPQSWMLLDFLRLAKQQNRTKQDSAIQIFTELAETNSNNTIQLVSLLAIAEIHYNRKHYISSKNIYKKGLNLVIDETIYAEDVLSFIQIAKWRYLFSLVETDTDNFKSNYLEIIKSTQNSELYSNLLEEQLSKLLRNNQQSRILEEYNTYIRELNLAHQQVELLRWRSIISRFQKNITINTNVVKEYSRYLSDLPFDYLINTKKTITLEQFLEDWTDTSFKSEKNLEISEIELLIRGHIKFGLLDYAYNLSLQHIDDLSLELLNTLAQALSTKEYYSKSLNLMRIASANNKNILLQNNALKRLYPTPYLEVVESLTNKPIEKAMMYGIMREESSFDPKIQSSAKAIGLMQLLYPTAEDIASRIDFDKDIVLTDVDTNIRLGYEYMKYLIRVLDTPLKAIASYNGGMGNVWKWEKLYDDQDLILFADSLPFRETRNYVRKVSSSAMIYGLLYFGVSPKEFQNFLLSK